METRLTEEFFDGAPGEGEFGFVIDRDRVDVFEVHFGVMPSLGEAMLPAELVLVPLTPRLQRELVICGPASRPWHPLAEALVDSLDGPSPETTRRAGELLLA